MNNKNVVITGSRGFIGRNLMASLLKLGANVFGYTRHNCDCTNFDKLLYNLNIDEPDYIFHCASFNGNIIFNNEYPADIFYINTIMGLNLLRACTRLDKIPIKIVLPITSCAFPSYEIPIQAESLFHDHPDDSIACHGYAKRNIQLACKFYNQQYNLPAVTVCPNTIIGPGDSLDLNKTKVGMSIIKKICDAYIKQEKSVTLFGSGNVKRGFIYIDDVCNAMITIGILYTDSKIPWTLPSHEVIISEYAEMVKQIVGYSGEIIWDKSRPDGQKRKILVENGLVPIKLTPLEEAISNTVRWYQHIQKTLIN
jgi:GDP-L-fucose synthase